MWPVAAPLVIRMRGYTSGVATVRVLPYPALVSLFFSGITQNPDQIIQMAQIAANPTCGSGFVPVAQLYYYISPDASQLTNLHFDTLWRRLCSSAPGSGKFYI